MSQYKKVSTCCGSTIVKDEKACDCPCLLFTGDITSNFSVDSVNTTSELYNGKAIGIVGTVLLTLATLNLNDVVVFNFFSNGTLNKSITLNANQFNKFFTCDNVTRIEVVFVAGTDPVEGLMRWGAVNEPCK
ncbi:MULTISPECIES: hypothetical protein [Bacillaceae]|uniref:hypothetical protein n=1 Tax=Bacillaceae TaxID=186817 RepID=UPI001BDEE1B5|nr:MULTISPECIES: hypothetical protein [Bacillaceae]MDX8362460.1 hypothetical protein [Cytobacillus sp. IB215316]